MGFSNMTPVQAGTIPRAMKNQDCVVEVGLGSPLKLATRPMMYQDKGAIVLTPDRQ
jgi:hypothetical protein